MSNSCPSNIAISFLLFVKGTHILYYTQPTFCIIQYLFAVQLNVMHRSLLALSCWRKTQTSVLQWEVQKNPFSY